MENINANRPPKKQRKPLDNSELEIIRSLEERALHDGGLKLLPVGVVKATSELFETPVREIEIMALENGLLPARYRRNTGTAGIAGQIKLLKSKVAVIGCGGLGGYVIEMLARMGVGRLVLVDGDEFDDNNLNRQLISTETNLRKPKAREAARRVLKINSAVSVEAHVEFAGRHNIKRLLAGCDVAVDALDNVSSRFMLEAACRELGIPMVHGAIAGFAGQVTTVLPGGPGLAAIYGPPDSAPDKGVEQELGNPAPTPAIVAAWEVEEVIKLILNIGTPLSGRLLYFDALEGQVQVIQMSGASL